MASALTSARRHLVSSTSGGSKLLPHLQLLAAVWTAEEGALPRLRLAVAPPYGVALLWVQGANLTSVTLHQCKHSTSSCLPPCGQQPWTFCACFFTNTISQNHTLAAATAAAHNQLHHFCEASIALGNTDKIGYLLPWSTGGPRIRYTFDVALECPPHNSILVYKLHATNTFDSATSRQT